MRSIESTFLTLFLIYPEKAKISKAFITSGKGYSRIWQKAILQTMLQCPCRKAQNESSTLLTIHRLSSMVSTFFDSFAANTTVLQDYLGDTSEARASRFRNSSGGNLLFRPVALTEYCSVALSLVKISSLDWDSTFQTLNRLPQQINEGPWLGLIWDGEKIINRVSRPVIKALLCYMTDCSLLSEKQRDKFYAEYSKALNITKGQAETRLHSFREWSKK